MRVCFLFSSFRSIVCSVALFMILLLSTIRRVTAAPESPTARLLRQTDLRSSSLRSLYDARRRMRCGSASASSGGSSPQALWVSQRRSKLASMMCVGTQIQKATGEAPSSNIYIYIFFFSHGHIRRSIEGLICGTD